MDVTSALIGEHGVFHLLVEQLDDAIGRCERLDELKAAAGPLAISLLGHARVEEETLFRPLEARIGLEGPLRCLRDEHEQMDRRLRALFHITDVDTMRTALQALLDLTRRHLAREEQVLFTIATEALPADDREHLGSHWAKARGVTLPERR